jgi:Cu2+-exporting ATPase
MSVALAAVCAHCGLPTGDPSAKFCCEGCRAVHDLLVASDLERYYDLRGERGVPQNDVRPDRHDTKWLDAIEDRRDSGIERIDLDLQGLHCSACVWLIETLFARHGGADLAINPALGRARLVVPASFDLRAFVLDVERFGYRFGPPSSRPLRRSNALLWRLGVCIAIAMNTMIFAFAIYAGLRSGPVFIAFERLNLALSSASVIVGGSVFFRAAWQSIRRGVLHLDLPIALGIVLAFAGSVASFIAHRASGVFVDTLDVFIALMLLGRYLQERVLDRNRLAILEDDGTRNLLARRARGGRVEIVQCVDLEPGDRIVIAGGDVVPVDARVPLGKRGSFSLDWLNGESTPHAFEENQIVPAGAFSASKETVALVVERDFERSGLADLLRAPSPRDARAPEASRFWDRFSRLYVVGVLAVAVAGFVGWMIATHDAARALEVTTAVLVVTCPCAFGIATPLAYDLATAGLRRAGLFIRTPGFLDRAARVKTVVFDKTGTLTSGELRMRNSKALDALDDRARAALVDLASATWHPKSAAVLRALGVRVDTSFRIVEQHARGVSMCDEGHEWRLGARDWVTRLSAPSSKLAFGVDGVELTTIEIEEDLRRDARDEASALAREGFDVWLLSGDDRAHTEATARAAGIPASHAIGACTAQEKAEWIEQHDHDDLLMIGDGINDSLAVERATCGGTPAIDRPFMAARSDFYFITPGLRPIRLALEIARRVTRVRTRNLTFALAYNVLSIGLAYAGVMSPLLCAVLMPASSLTIVLATVLSLSPRSSSWKF